jgi:hypothetical protein
MGDYWVAVGPQALQLRRYQRFLLGVVVLMHAVQSYQDGFTRKTSKNWFGFRVCPPMNKCFHPFTLNVSDQFEKT